MLVGLCVEILELDPWLVLLFSCSRICVCLNLNWRCIGYIAEGNSCGSERNQSGPVDYTVLYNEVMAMMADGYSENMLATAFDHLCENEKTARGFLAKNARMRKLWLDGFLFSQIWLAYFMLTVMVDLGINCCCSTSIDIPLYYICSLLYYWDDTIAQIMYLYCLDTTCRYHFCTLLRDRKSVV